MNRFYVVNSELIFSANTFLVKLQSFFFEEGVNSINNYLLFYFPYKIKTKLDIRDYSRFHRIRVFIRCDNISRDFDANY